MMRFGAPHGRTPTLFVVLLGLWGSGQASAGTDRELESAVFRTKPAVVMIAVRVEAAASVRCGGGQVQFVRPAPVGRVGSGFFIHPDGWVATNGHVVQLFHDPNEAALTGQLLERAVEEGCGPALEGLTGRTRRQRIRAWAADPANRRGIRIEKALEVSLANGRIYAAEIKTYSPPAYVAVGSTRDASGAVRTEYGKDVAILKIAARDLPVVRLARRSTGLHLGQAVFVIGFPGVVLHHDLLSTATRFEPTVTVGHVSGFRQDVGGQRVIQTDTAIIQGHSGGPAFDDRGNAVGAATFVSLQEGRVVQGFNFLIPVETIHEAARQAGVTPESESAFTRFWNRGVDLYLAGRHAPAYQNLMAATRFYPGFPDVERVKEDCLARIRERPPVMRAVFRWGLAGVAALAAAVGLWFGGRRAATARRRRIRQMIREELQALGVSRG